MEKAKVPAEKSVGAERPLPPGQERSSLLGWVRRKLRRIMNRKKKDLEIYPLW